MRIAGGVAVVTGASSGIGRATAMELAARGAIVVAVARREERLREVVAAVEAAGGSASAAACDVADAAAVATAAADVLERHGRIDILVNAAGTPLHRSLADCTVGDIEHVMRVNYMGMVHWAKAVLPSMSERRHGAMVSIASTAGTVPWTWEAGYSASKAAVIAFTEAVAPELAQVGVHAAWVNPGLVRTEIFSAESLRHIPRGAARTWQEPEAVARAVARVIERERHGVTVPRYMAVPGLVRQLTPRLYRAGLRRTYEGTLRGDRDRRGGAGA